MTYHQTPHQVAVDALLTEPLHSLLIAPRVIELLRIPGKNKIGTKKDQKKHQNFKATKTTATLCETWEHLLLSRGNTYC